MSPFLVFLIGLGVGVVGSIAGFIWLNRNEPDKLDKAEDAVRKIHKPF